MNKVFKVTEFIKDPVQFVSGEITCEKLFEDKYQAWDYARYRVYVAQIDYGVVFIDEDDENMVDDFEYYNEDNQTTYRISVKEMEIN